MNRKLWVVAWAALVGSSGAVYAQPGPTPVFVDTVQMELIEQRRQVTGELRATRRAEVAVEEPGIVAELRVREGQRVNAGEVLLRIDDTRLRLFLDEVQAELAQAEASKEEALAQAEYWARETQVLEQASSQGAATEKELRDARYESRLSNAKRDQAARSTERIAARLALLEDRLEDAQVVAPFAGVIVERRTEVGAWVDEGQSVVVLLGTDEHQAWLDVPQGLLPSAQESAVHSAMQSAADETGEQANEEGGTHASNSEAARGSKSLTGFLTPDDVLVRIDATGDTYSLVRMRIVPEVSRAGRTFVLVGVVDAPEEALLSGGSLLGFVPSGESGQTLTVSKDAVLRGAAGSYVMVIRPGREGSSTAVPTSVSVLFETENRVAIAPGSLQAGDKVVTEGAERLMPGSTVVVTESPLPPPRAASSGGGGSRGEPLTARRIAEPLNTQSVNSDHAMQGGN